MPNAAYRRRVQALATGAIAMVAAAGQSLPAHADDTQHKNTSNKMLTDAHPAWATADKDRGAVPASQQVTTRVFLTGQNAAAMAALAQSMSDPSSPDYQHYMTPDQVQQQFGATPAQISAVQNWLKGAGLSISAVHTDWIDATGSADAVQKAFGTTLKNYQRPDGSVGFAASSAAVVPAGVADLVAGVAGLTQSSAASQAHTNSVKEPGTARPSGKSASTHGAGANAGGPNPTCEPKYYGQTTTNAFPAGSNGPNIPVAPCAYGPDTLRSAYGLTGSTGKGASIAIVGWGGSSTIESDANAWSQSWGVRALSGEFSEVHTPAVASNPPSCGDFTDEQALDVEMTHGLAPDANITYIGAATCDDQDILAAESYAVDHHSADVVSNSWGQPTHSVDGSVSEATMNAYDRVFQRGALEGMSFTFSTGDCGDENPGNKPGGAVNCVNNSARVQTDFPAQSPWVTAVGGTTLATNSSGGYAWEVAMGDHRATAVPGAPSWNPGVGHIPFYFGGGGGTSEDYAQPWYQQGKVPAALANHTANPNGVSRPMRVIPDVAMDGSLATAVDVQFGGFEYDMGGTSVAAPSFAGVLADTKEAAGGHAVGFANPSLYALNGSAYHDVTSRPGITEMVKLAANGEGHLYQVGEDNSLAATPGYDSATGLGSPSDGFVSQLAAQVQHAPGEPPQAVAGVTRIAGNDRYETAIAVSKKSFPGNGSAPAVVLATGGNFPDALAGVPLAKKLGAPLLLTPGTGSNAEVIKEIHRVLAPGGHVYVLGGTAAVSPATVNALGIPGAQISRIAGGDRYSTSVAIAHQMGNPSSVVLATGNNFADALAAGPFAADIFNGGDAAILLTNDKVEGQAAIDYISHNVPEGGLAAVGGQAVAAAHYYPGVLNIMGDTRYGTAAKVAGYFPQPQIVGVATGTAYPDALTGAALLAHYNSPLLLTEQGSLAPESRQVLQGLAHAIAGGGSVDVFGGPVAISQTVVNQIGAAIHV
jgi:putative cell wall-binding protein